MVATVLVVEDEALIADDLQRTLVRLGYHVPETAASGREAIRLVGAHQPALVLMDIKLRGAMDGIEAAREIRAKYAVPVVFLTSHSDEATLQRAKETDPYGYLIKPFNDRELRTAIEVALHKHQLEAQLVRRERWFATTLASIGDAVLATDRNETITFINPVAEKVTGWLSADALGRPLTEVLRLVDGSGVPIPSPIRVAFQQEFAVQLPPSGEGGETRGEVVVFRDVTDRKRLEQRLAQSERLASLGTLAAGMGHEINNPLTAIVGNLSFAQEAAGEALRRLVDQPLDERVATETIAELRAVLEALADATKGADRVRKIVQDLRRFARAETVASQALEISDVVETALGMTRQALAQDTRVIKDFGTTPFVLADQGQLVQVFANLIANAAEALHGVPVEHGELRIRTTTDDAGRAVIEIADTGGGIAAEVLPRIFDPFFTTKRIGDGPGLGLSVCHNLVASLGGEITVDSKVGRGTTVRVALPPARAPQKTQTIRIPLALPTVARSRVLIVDDEDVVVRSLQRILSKAHDVATASDGAQALAMIARTRYDLILCDLMMPVMSGVDLYDSVASANPDQASRMVFMTGGAFTERTQQFLDSTTNRYVLKPFTAATLKAIAAEVISGAPWRTTS